MLVLTTNAWNDRSDIQAAGSELEQVNDFCYLGSYISQNGSCEKNVNVRIGKPGAVFGKMNKKLSYRRETARQLPTWREGGVRPSSPLPLRPLWLYLCVWLNPKATT